MNKSIFISIFALYFGSMTKASAIDTPATGFTTNKVKAFSAYLEQNQPMFYQVNSDAWKNYSKVVTNYTEGSSKITKMTPAEQAAFLQSSAEIQKELGLSRNSNSAIWIKEIKRTTAIINFIWESQKVDKNIIFENAPKQSKAAKALVL